MSPAVTSSPSEHQNMHSHVVCSLKIQIASLLVLCSSAVCVCLCPEASALLVPLLEGDYTAVLQNPTVSELLRGDGSCQQGEQIEAYMERRLRLYLTEATAADQTDR